MSLECDKQLLITYLRRHMLHPFRSLLNASLITMSTLTIQFKTEPLPVLNSISDHIYPTLHNNKLAPDHYACATEHA